MSKPDPTPTTVRRTDTEIDADPKTCRLDNEAGEVIGYITLRRDQVPAAFRYRGIVYLQGYKRVFNELKIMDVETCPGRFTDAS